jgi:hypothetical protein
VTTTIGLPVTRAREAASSSISAQVSSRRLQAGRALTDLSPRSCHGPSSLGMYWQCLFHRPAEF